MDDPIAFLNVRLDEDAERAYSGWGRDPEGRWENMDEGNSVMTPRAVLADIAAKRQIIAKAEQARERQGLSAEDEDHWWDMHEVVAMLALPFASHPDYREEWRP